MDEDDNESEVESENNDQENETENNSNQINDSSSNVNSNGNGNGNGTYTNGKATATTSTSAVRKMYLPFADNVLNLLLDSFKVELNLSINGTSLYLWLTCIVFSLGYRKRALLSVL